MKQRKRLDRVQKALNPAPKMLKIPVYLCSVDGREMQMEILEVISRRLFDGQEVTSKRIAGYRYEPAATPEQAAENMREVQAWMTTTEEEYNKDPDAYNARCAAEMAEIKRLAPLRREDRRQGKDPDKEHPYSFRILFPERTENA